MNRRRPHQKSRNGCFQCKKGRVKCDEQRPRCKKCIDHDAKCNYASTPGKLVWADEKSVPDSVPSDQSSSDRDVVAQESLPRLGSQQVHNPNSSEDGARTASSASLNPEGLELIINWFLSTIHSVTNGEPSLHIVQDVISRLAMAHEFLMHGILAFSALDLANQKEGSERIKYTTMAHAHYDRGISIFGPKLQNITSSNSGAVIAFSSITTMFSFASSRPDDSSKGLKIVDELAQVFYFARGWYDVVRASEAVSEGNLNGNFTLPDGANEISTDTDEALKHLHDLNDKSGSRHVWHETEVYMGAIDSLKVIFKSLKDKQHDPHFSYAWGNILPARFIELLQEHQTFALIVVAHYCVVLHHIRQVWWLKGWSRGLIEAIWANIDPAHQKSLSWPRAKIGMANGSPISLE